MLKRFSFLFVAVLIAFLAFRVFRPIPTPAPVNSDISVTLIIDSQSYPDIVPQGTSAFGLLQKVTQANNISLTFKTYDFGTLVESINNKPNTSDLSWIYYINNNSASVGADKYILQPQDVIEWKYIKPTF